jgi:Bacterial regulatory proteins, luxR family
MLLINGTRTASLSGCSDAEGMGSAFPDPRGATNPQIAQRLGVTESAAKFHVSDILSKLGVESGQEAAAYCAVPKRSWLVLPFFALPAHWKMALRRRDRLAAIAVAGAATVSVIFLVALLTRGDGSGTQAGEASRFDEALAPDVPPAQPAATLGPEAFLGTPCQRTAIATKNVRGRMMAISLVNFCVTWSDVFTDETGFRVEIKHGGGEFVYHLPADATEMYPPPSDWPYGAVKEVQVEVYAAMPAGEEMVEQMWLRSDDTWGAGRRPGDLRCTPVSRASRPARCCKASPSGPRLRRSLPGIEAIVT